MAETSTITTRSIQITIAGEDEAEGLIEQGRPFTHLISLRSPSVYFKTIDGYDKFAADSRLTLYFDDVTHDSDHVRAMGYVPPEQEDVENLIAFARKVRDEDATKPISLLCHCAAGVSRSTAVAYVFLCVMRGPGSELEAIVDVFNARSFAQPNTLVIKHADEILRDEHHGEVLAVAEQIIARRKSARTYGQGL